MTLLRRLFRKKRHPRLLRGELLAKKLTPLSFGGAPEERSRE